MDIVSHGLWGSLFFGRTHRRAFSWAFFWGVFPDLASFGLYTAGTWIGLFDHPDWSSGNHPDPSVIPAFVHQLYNFSHSLVIFSVVFIGVWIIWRRPVWPLAAWGLHILIDIPTHSSEFFPTPFLFPLSDFSINGIPWSRPFIFFPNVILLVGLYTWFYWFRRKRGPTLPQSTA
jgi:hypothetical protein